MKYTIIVLLTLLSIQCKPKVQPNNPPPVAETIPAPPPPPSPPPPATPFHEVIDSSVNIVDTTTIEISDITYDYDSAETAANGEYSKEMLAWHPDSAMIVNVLRKFQAIEGPDIHNGYCYFHTSCDGKVKISGHLFTFGLSPASYLYLTNDRVQILLGDNKKLLKKDFVTTGYQKGCTLEGE